LLDASKAAAETAIDAFNRVRHPYRKKTALMLLTNAWELLAKAILVQAHEWSYQSFVDTGLNTSPRWLQKPAG
jgi:Domain of unknown function (DUF3644)